MVNLTVVQIKALRIIRDNPEIRAAYFAELMWPDSNMHRKVSNQGHGACRGKAAWLCGGSYMGKLRNKGLIKYYNFEGYSWTYRLTSKAKKLLDAKSQK